MASLFVQGNSLQVVPELLAATALSGPVLARRRQLDEERAAQLDDRKRRIREELLASGPAERSPLAVLRAAEREAPAGGPGLRGPGRHADSRAWAEERAAFQQALAKSRPPDASAERPAQQRTHAVEAAAAPPASAPAVSAAASRQTASPPASQGPVVLPVSEATARSSQPLTAWPEMARQQPATAPASPDPRPASAGVSAVARLQPPATHLALRAVAAPAGAVAASQGNTSGLSVAPASGPRSDLSGSATARRAATAEQAAESRSGANFERILRTLRMQIRSDRTTATVRLDPPELGRIRLHLDLQSTRLALRIEAQTELARGLLSGELDELRRGLDAAGIHLESVTLRPLPGAATAQPSAADDADPQGQLPQEQARTGDDRNGAAQAEGDTAGAAAPRSSAADERQTTSAVRVSATEGLDLLA